jgi:hemerythrin
MYLITWNARYATGIEEIDEHHRHLVELLNTVYDHFVNRTPCWDGAKIFAELTAYTRLHFAAEESLMRAGGYPGYALHKIRHKQFAARLEEMRDTFCSGQREMSFELLTFLNTWLLSHILDADADMGRFVMANGHRKAA